MLARCGSKNSLLKTRALIGRELEIRHFNRAPKLSFPASSAVKSNMATDFLRVVKCSSAPRLKMIGKKVI
jgi:hypothetical protein